MTDFLSLTEVPKALREHDVNVTYNRCWRACTEGVIPAMKLGNRWIVQRDHLPQIAAALSPAPAEQ